MSEIIICIPAWGAKERWMANEVVIPTVSAALRSTALSYEFRIYTDDQHGFNTGGSTTFFRPVIDAPTPHDALTAIHTETLNTAPVGSLVCLLNADIIPSQELFTIGVRVLSDGQHKVLASFGLRTLFDNQLPYMLNGKELLAWGWEHRHPIVDNCTWGSGKTAFPVTLFFVEGKDVVAHCSHLHPFLIRKESRSYDFRGTIDDGLLQLFRDNEVYYCKNREVAFIELSPLHNPVAPHFMQVRDDVLDPAFVIEFGKHYLTSHCRNLRQPIRICGDGPVDTSIPVCIADRIGGNL